MTTLHLHKPSAWLPCRHGRAVVTDPHAGDTIARRCDVCKTRYRGEIVPVRGVPTVALIRWTREDVTA